MNAWQNDKSQVAQVYDGLAKTFEEHTASLIHYGPAVRAFLAENVQSGRRILDLGCGTGRWTRDLPPDVEVVGVDISPGMLEEARRARPSGTYIVHDFHRALPTELGAFDAILASGCFDFCENLTHVMGNLAAVLAPGGCFYFTISERRPELPFHDQRWGLPGRPVDIRVCFWTFSETTAAIDGSGLRPLTYRHAPGWEIPDLPATIYYGYWVVERPRAAGIVSHPMQAADG